MLKSAAMPLDPLQANASSSYEDARRHLLSTPQKLKGFLVQVITASFGHKPGHVPNASLQKAWAAEEKLACLERRYLPLDQADTYRTTVNSTGAIFSAADAVQGLVNE